MAARWTEALRRWSSALATLAPRAATASPPAQSPPTRSVALERADFTAALTAAGITPSTIVSALATADRGQPAYLCDIVDSMLERDGHMAGALRLRRLAVVGAPTELLEPRGSDPRNAEITSACQEQLDALIDLHDYKLHLTSSLHHPIAPLANLWDVSGGQARVTKLIPFPAKRFAWNTQYEDEQMGELGELRLLSRDLPVYGERLWDGAWTINSDAALAAWPFRAGLGRLLVWQFLFKIYAVKDWATYAELCGLPLIYAKIDRTAPDADRRALAAGLASLGTEATCIFSPGTDLETINRAVHDGQIYSKLVHFQNDEVSKAVLGHVASADAVSGSLGGAETTAVSVRQDLLEADARSLEKAIRKGILAPFVGYNFGEEARRKLLPRFHVLVDLPDNLKVRAEVDQALVQMGLPLSLRYFYETYGRPMPSDGEPTLSPADVAVEPASDVTDAADAPTVTDPATIETAAPTLSLNGAQVASLLEVIDRVARGTLPRDTGIEVIVSAFALPRDQAEQLMGEVGRGFVPAVETPDGAPAAAPAGDQP